MIGVICGTSQEYSRFLLSVEKGDREIFKRITDLNEIRGRNFKHVIRVGTWYKLKDIGKLYFESKLREFANDSSISANRRK